MISLLKERKKNFFYPVSATTRSMREWEKDWETYYFLKKDEFEDWIDKWDFLEFACVHWKSYYWTLKKPILDAVDSWKTVIREVDVQWFDSISKTFPKDKLFSIFILPPSENILRERIKTRAPISDEELDARMKTMKNELVYSKKADYTLSQWSIEEMYENLLRKILEIQTDQFFDNWNLRKKKLSKKSSIRSFK